MEIHFDCCRAFPLMCLKVAKLIKSASERVLLYERECQRALLWHCRYCFTCYTLEFHFKSPLAYSQVFVSSLKSETLGTSCFNDNYKTIYKCIEKPFSLKQVD